MKNVLIVGVLGLTAATFYSALWHKSDAIEDDIRTRVTEALATASPENITVDVDGRHVTLSGLVHSTDQERKLLSLAEGTEGALGPIDGLAFVAPSGFVSAVKTAKGIALTGTAPDDATRMQLIDAAKRATDGEIEDALQISGPEGAWHDEAEFGLAQLGLMSAGTMMAGAGTNVLTGVATEAPSAIQQALEERGGWVGQVGAPDKSAALAAQVDGLTKDLDAAEAKVGVRDASILDLREKLSTAEGERDSLRLAFQAEIEAKDGSLKERDAVVATLSEQVEALEASLAAKGADADALAKKLSAAEDALAAAQSSFTADLSAKDAVVVERDAAIAKLQAEVENLQAGVTQGDASAEDLTADLAVAVAALDTERSERASEAEAQGAALAEREARIAKLQTELDALQSEMTKAAASTEGLSADLQTARAALKTEQAERASETEAQAAALAERDATIAKLEQDLETVRADRPEDLASITALTSQLAAAEAQFEAERIGFTADIETKDRALAKLQETVATLEAEQTTAAAASADATKEVQEALAKQTAALQAAEAQVTEQQALAAQRTQALQEALAQMENLTARISEREGRIGLLETAVADGEAKLAKLNVSLGQANQIIAERNQMIADLQALPPDVVQIERCSERIKTVIAGSRISFVTASAEISEQSVPLLERLTGIAIACSGGGAVLEIGGHTDDQGEEADNQALSEARATSVVDFMAARGVPKDGMKPVGYGESDPIADNSTAEGRAVNRRISFAWLAQ